MDLKRLISVISFLSVIILCCPSCGQEQTSLTQNQKPYLTMTGLRSFNFPKEGGSQVVAFSCNRSWSVSSTETWAQVSPSSGAATEGDVKVTITIGPNATYETRSAKLTIKVEDLKEEITVTQAEGKALIVSPKSYELTNAAQTIEVTVQQNIDYTFEIDEKGKGWIEKSGTKGLTTDKVLFKIAANTEYDEREGSITFKQTGGDLRETLTIRQSQANGLFVTTPQYELSNAAHTLSVEVKANVEFEVASQTEWIKYVETKALKPSTVVLSVEANESYDSRTGTVQVKQKNGDLTGTITVIQSPADGLIVTPTDFELSSEEQSIEVKVANNVPFSVVIPDDAKDWVSVLSNTQTKALTDDTVVLYVAKNSDYNARETSVTFKQVDGSLAETVSIRQGEGEGLFVTTPEYQLSNAAHTLDVEVQANVEFEIAPQVDWISYVWAKSLTASTITLSILANDTYDSRQGTVLVKQKNGTLTGTITIKQSQTEGLVVTPTSFNLKHQSQAIEITVNNNVPFSIIIPDGAKDWVSVISNTQTKALVPDNVQFSIAENKSKEARSASITIKQDNGSLAETITINQRPDVRPESGYIVAGYATYWGSTMPDPTYLTHINYAFATIQNDFETLNIRNTARLSSIVDLKAKNSKLKVLLTIGGWGAGNFSEMAADATHRKNFCNNCLTAVNTYNLDGIDIDWEYPTSTTAGISASPDDTKNFTLLLKDLRETLGADKLLTMASASSAKYIDWPSAIEYLDWVNIMSYYMGKPTNHHSALYYSLMTPSGNAHNCDGSIKLHHDKGVPYDMLVMGIPFFGVNSSGDEISYNQVYTYGSDRRWDDVAKVPYLVADSGKMILSFDDEYSVEIKAEYIKQKGLLGAMYWNIEADDANWSLSKAIAGPLLGWVDPDCTVYGMVMCEGEGVANVSVSDGVEVARTNGAGFYKLKSKKAHNYVFVSIPSGYETPCQGILPIMHVQLEKSATVAERHDFQLIKAQNQDHHTMMLLGDIHLAKRTDDRTQFSKFVKDLNEQVSATSGPVYALTLGDMTWDLYWKVNTYGYKEYLQDANAIKNLTVFHTIGNHDHSMYEVGDINTVAEYKKVIAPTYYSFNIGKVHYVVLDDVECTNKTATTDDKGNPCYVREYNGKLVQEQIDWLKKDLAYVPKSSPLVVTMHIPMYNASGSGRMSGYSTLADILAEYPEVHVYTAHTHVIYNVDQTATNHIFEHNAGAICATWWWSAYETPGIHIGQDGSPGGYTIMDVNGTNFSWQFKATGSPTDYQFRSYDRNQIFLTADKYVSNGSNSHKGQFEPGIWGTANTANEVYINVWNWDPSWKIEVSENGTKLDTPEQVTVKDPLHLIAYTAKRLDKNAVATFATGSNSHTFKVKASSASSTLNIKVTDRFGNVYTETMTRPRAFSTDTYKQE